MHPFVVGELACGSLAQRQVVLQRLGDLPASVVAGADEVTVFIEHHRLHGKGLGTIDTHLPASTLLTPGAALWTRDQPLQGAARTHGRAFVESGAH